MINNLEIAIQAALAAGKEIMKVYATEFLVETKEDNTPLTQADKNANEVINEHLKITNIPILSEENKQLDFSERKDWTSFWLVDPLDGTKEFVKRNGEFTVNIALVVNGNPMLGVIYIPVLKSLYFTNENASACYKYHVEKDDITISEILLTAQKLQPTKKKGQPIKILVSRSYLNDETQKFISEIKKEEVEIIQKGSALKFCLLAEGKGHIYPRFAPTMEWDTAAGQAICNAVGLQLIDMTTNKPMKYNKPNLLNNNFIVK